MKKIFSIVLVMFFILFLTGCKEKKVEENNDKSSNTTNKESEEIKIVDSKDYYINYYIEQVIKDYQNQYISYTIANPGGSLNDLKRNIDSLYPAYTFQDLNNDNILEFILIKDREKDDYHLTDYKELMIYTLNSNNEVIPFLSGDYYDNLYYNASKDVFLTKRSNDNVDTYEVLIFDGSKYKTNMGISYNKVSDIYIKETSKILTRDELLNGNMSKEEYLSYTSGLKSYDLEFNLLETLLDKDLEDIIWEAITFESNNEDLNCTKEDVDKAIEIFKNGEKLSLDIGSDLKIDTTKKEQNNKEYPYFTLNVVRCGSYFKILRISHK